MPTRVCLRGWKPGRSSASAPGVSRHGLSFGRQARGWAVPLVRIACGAAGGAYLLCRRRRSWLLLVPVSLLLAIGVVALVHWILVDLMATFSENLPFQTVAWAVPAVAALLLCAARFPRNSWRGRSFSVAAMLGVCC